MNNKYLALLRGINVGGNNIIPMARLKKVFEAAGMDSVLTYIQSGNVIFELPRALKLKFRTSQALENHLAAVLLNKLNYQGAVIVITQKELELVVKQAPDYFFDKNRRNDVLFFKRPLRAKKAYELLIKEVKPRQGVDEICLGKVAVYFSRNDKLASKSRLPQILKTEIYAQLSIRNWNTTSKLYELIAKD